MQANRSARSPRPVSVCSFTFADGRQCRLPRRQGHPYLCLFHEKKEAQILAGEQAGQDIASFLNGGYISACDLASALARLFSAVAQGHIKPKTAATLAYLGQTLVQTLHLAQDEYINAFGTDAWRKTVRSSFTPVPSPAAPTPPPPSPPPASNITPATIKCSGGSLDPSVAPMSASSAPPPPPPVAPRHVAPRSGGSLNSSASSPSKPPAPQPHPPSSSPTSVVPRQPDPSTPLHPPSSNVTPATIKCSGESLDSSASSPSKPPTSNLTHADAKPSLEPTHAADRWANEPCAITVGTTQITGRLRDF